MVHNAHAPYLYTTPYGRVFRCICCDRVQVEFADLALPMNRPYFEKLDRCLKEAVLDSTGNRWIQLQLDTHAGRVHAPLRPWEVHQLHGLVSGAHAMMRLHDHVRTVARGGATQRA